ncbi:MAG: AAA family ATPase [Pseudomonadales bacterium]
MSIIVRKVKASGFRGFYDEASVEFGRRFTVITGRNGSGKSSLCDAVEFALTGGLRKFEKLTRTQSREAAEYFWWQGENEPPKKSVTLELELDTGDIVEITRDHRGRLEGLSEEDLLSLLSSRESSAFDDVSIAIERMVKPAFIRDEFIAELSLDLTERARFDFVQEILGCFDISPYAKTLDQAFRTAGTELKALETRTEEMATIVFQARTELSNARSQSASEEHQQALNALSALMTEAEGDDGVDVIREGQQRADSLGSAIDDIESVVSLMGSAQQEIGESDVAQSITETEQELETINADLSRIDESLSAAAEPDSDGTTLAELCRIGRHFGVTDAGECPLCGSSVTEAAFNESLERIEERVGELEALITARAALTGRRDVARAELRRLADLASLNADRVANLVSSFRDIRSRVGGESSAAESGAPDLASAQADAKALIEQLESDQAKIAALLERLSAYNPPEALDELEAQIRAVEAEAEALDAQKVSKEKTREKLRTLSHTASRLSHQFLDQRLASLDPLLAELYARLRPHASWEDIRYDVRGDVRRSLSLMVTSGETTVNPSYMFSSGQRRAAGIAFLIAVGIANSWSNLDTLFLDDPVQHVDDYRSMHLVETIAACVRGGHQIVCTVEDPALANLLSRRVPSSDDESIRIDMGLRPSRGASVLNVHPLRSQLKAVLESA